MCRANLQAQVAKACKDRVGLNAASRAIAEHRMARLQLHSASTSPSGKYIVAHTQTSDMSPYTRHGRPVFKQACGDELNKTPQARAVLTVQISVYSS